MKNGRRRSGEHRISIMPTDEQQVLEETIDLERRSRSKENIKPEDWSILDILLPPAREPADHAT